jgi:hypothetical protein
MLTPTQAGYKEFLKTHPGQHSSPAAASKWRSILTQHHVTPPPVPAHHAKPVHTSTKAVAPVVTKAVTRHVSQVSAHAGTGQGGGVNPIFQNNEVGYKAYLASHPYWHGSSHASAAAWHNLLAQHAKG